jgi:hypothetical protein
MTPLTMAPKCPATYCPLFAADGSRWTGDVNMACERGPTCGFWYRDRCVGVDHAFEVLDVPLIVLSPDRPACRFEATCQWQQQMGGILCPPRTAIVNGVDPCIVG